MNLIDSLIKEGWLKTPAIIEAFKGIKRSDFMAAGKGFEDISEINQAFPIGYGQTISQPLTVAFMMEKLRPELGDKVLDVGSGSGWTTALLAYIAGDEGRVIGLEIVPELKEFGENNVSKYGFIRSKRAEIILQDGSLGYEKEAPYDRILVSASAKKIPEALKEQLKIGGRMVIPVGSNIVAVEKKSKNDFKETDYPGFAFVPLV